MSQSPTLVHKLNEYKERADVAFLEFHFIYFRDIHNFISTATARSVRT